MKPATVQYQEKADSSLPDYCTGPKTFTKSREGSDYTICRSVILGTETLTRARENADSDFYSASGLFS